GLALAAAPSREACLTAAQHARMHGTKIIFDIDYRPYTWRSKEEIAIYYSLMARLSDVVIGSRDEVNFAELLPEDAETPPDHEIAEKYLSWGNKIVVIKHGKRGSVAYTADRHAYKVQSYHVKLLKSFGGGDAYASAFVHGLLEGLEVPEALRHATAHAAMVVASHSCSEAMQTIDQIEAFIKEHAAEEVITEIDWKEKV
ncbi:MAG: bifunctional hydroxymethylpyrimidine kinase/phosphomethylpyrimidine kinase, partial [Selenomonadaceae bacterium]|nr:bifunctional hydroxymethylpyrimidine kinase/phosphomethylpyrimidine kinase [Selenomonadaceae bacterium]